MLNWLNLLKPYNIEIHPRIFVSFKSKTKMDRIEINVYQTLKDFTSNVTVITPEDIEENLSSSFVLYINTNKPITSEIIRILVQVIERYNQDSLCRIHFVDADGSQLNIVVAFLMMQLMDPKIRLPQVVVKVRRKDSKLLVPSKHSVILRWGEQSEDLVLSLRLKEEPVNE